MGLISTYFAVAAENLNNILIVNFFTNEQL